MEKKNRSDSINSTAIDNMVVHRPMIPILEKCLPELISI